MRTATIRWVQSSLRKSRVGFVLALVLAHGLNRRADADFLVAADETLAAMMMDSEEEALYLTQQFGGLDAPLSFTSRINPASRSYSYSANPGSVYDGMGLSLTVTGAFDPTSGTWSSTSNGMLGGTPWVGTYTATFTDPPGTTDQATELTIGFWKIFTTAIHWSDDPLDPNRLNSSGTVVISKFNFVTGRYEDVKSFTEIDSRQKTVDELIQEYNNEAMNENGANRIDNGFGAFVVAPAAAVPEPSTLALTLTGLALTGFGMAFCRHFSITRPGERRSGARARRRRPAASAPPAAM
jgi:hypothetical protein